MAALGNGYANGNGNGNLLANVGKGDVPSLHRSAFPDDFAFGAASAAYQVLPLSHICVFHQNLIFSYALAVSIFFFFPTKKLIFH